MLKILLASEPVIDSRRRCLCGAGEGAHGQRLLAFLAPEAVSHIDNLAFETGIRLAWHRSFRVKNGTIILFTALKLQCINNGFFLIILPFSYVLLLLIGGV